MENFVELIKAIAWPATVIWILYFLKGDLRSLLGRIDKLKYKEAEASFEKDVYKVQAKAKEIGEKIAGEESAAKAENKEELNARDQLYRIAQISPRAAIVEAWRHLEEKINDLGPKFGLEARGYASERKILENLKAENKIDKDFFLIYATLRELRNRAAHKPEFALSQESAESYIDTTIKLIEGLERINKQFV
jgi:hypothetical protein